MTPVKPITPGSSAQSELGAGGIDCMDLTNLDLTLNSVVLQTNSSSGFSGPVCRNRLPLADYHPSHLLRGVC